MSDIITVTGRRQGLSVFINFGGIHGGGAVETYEPQPGTHNETRNNVMSGMGGNPDSHATVNVTLTGDASADTALQDAAANIVEALVKIESALTSVSANTLVQVAAGKSITAGEILKDLHHTIYNVTGNLPDNGGVGAAQRGEDLNIDDLYYRSFVGAGSYADPSYSRGQGMVGILLHELGHVSSIGKSVLEDEQNYYKKEYGDLAKFYNVDPSDRHSDCNFDDERFANTFSSNVAVAVGYSLDGYNATYGNSYQGAANIYTDHVGNHHNVVAGDSNYEII